MHFGEIGAFDRVFLYLVPQSTNLQGAGMDANESYGSTNAQLTAGCYISRTTNDEGMNEGKGRTGPGSYELGSRLLDVARSES